jgi:hypothetical protein
MINAYVKVMNYDDDFILLCDGKPILKGKSSKRFTANTKALAIFRLLSTLSATDYNQRYPAHGPVPEGYHHVKYVRKLLNKMLDESKSGKVPDGLYWGGNWDVQFVIEKGQ